MASALRLRVKTATSPPVAAETLLESIDLGNGADDHPGDNIAVVVPWTLPDAFDGIKESDLYAVQWLVSRGSGAGLSLGRCQACRKGVNLELRCGTTRQQTDGS